MRRLVALPLSACLAVTAFAGCQATGPRTARIDRPAETAGFLRGDGQTATATGVVTDPAVRLASRTAGAEPRTLTGRRPADSERVALPRTASVDADDSARIDGEQPIGSF